MPQEMPLWPTGQPPLVFEPDEAEHVDDRPVPQGMLAPNRCVVSVSQPTLTIYRPPQPASSRSAIVIYPGGGYRLLAIDKEGHHVARWLAGLGMVAAVCTYRTCPDSLRRHDHSIPDNVMQAIVSDGFRAMRLVRHLAPSLGVDPLAIGAMGFSAGANLCANVCFGEPVPTGLQDPVARESARMAFVAPIYPAWTDSLLRRVGQNAPPAFLCDADDDVATPPENSIALYAAYRKAGVSAELHLYRRGGHGFGMAAKGSALSGWTDAYAAWLRDTGLID